MRKHNQIHTLGPPYHKAHFWLLRMTAILITTSKQDNYALIY